MRRHLLADPDFPDLVGQWAAREAARVATARRCANDNRDGDGECGDPFLLALASLEVFATRLW